MTQDNTRAELLPCPCWFCGSPATRTAFIRCTDTFQGWEVECPSCGANGPHLKATEAEAIAAWNTRIEATRPTPSIGAEGLVEKADTTVKECLTVEMAEYSPAGGDRVMIWVNKRRTDLGGYCIEGVPRHAAPTILAALRASPPQEPVGTGEVARLRELAKHAYRMTHNGEQRGDMTTLMQMSEKILIDITSLPPEPVEAGL